MARLACRAPNHLGDGVVALPAVRGLAALGPLTVYGPRWASDLYRGLGVRVLPRGPVRGADVAVLLAPSLRAAWEARRAPRRIGTVDGDPRRWLLTEVVSPGLHTADTYRALAEAAGARVEGAPSWSRRAGDPVPAVPPGHVALDPLTGAGRVKEWQGFRALADRLEGRALFYAGPGEADAVRDLAGPHPVLAGLPLPALAGALSRCAAYVANDTGGAHFARACGVPTVVVYGPTVPERTGPAGALAVQRPGPGCRPCYGRRCRRGDHRCLEIPVDAVLDRVREVLGG